MRVELVTPSPDGLTDGNRVTARRYARILRALGHTAHVRTEPATHRADVMVALHATKSYAAAAAFRERCPDRPLIVVMTGTDLYGRWRKAPHWRAALRQADRIVLLQRHAASELPADQRRKARVIYQSAEPIPNPPPLPRRYVRALVVGHLRPDKDPLRAALAARDLPPSSRIQVVNVGRALTAALAERAARESERNPRFRWLGGRTPGATRRLIASSQLVVISSRAEGSSNVLSEALANHTPVLATRVAGLAGTLGASYPGYFPVGDTEALTGLLTRFETDPRFEERIRAAGREMAPLVAPNREKAAWRDLLAEIHWTATRRPDP